MKFSISIPLNGNALSIAQDCQKILSELLDIKMIMKNNTSPHINLISGTIINPNQIISIIKKLRFIRARNTELFGLGVFLTPNPLLYLRFKNSPFISELRYVLDEATSFLWKPKDLMVLNDVWTPKSTIAYNDLSINKLSDVLMALKHIKFVTKMEITELSFIDYTKKETELERISL